MPTIYWEEIYIGAGRAKRTKVPAAGYCWSNFGGGIGLTFYPIRITRGTETHCYNDRRCSFSCVVPNELQPTPLRHAARLKFCDVT